MTEIERILNDAMALPNINNSNLLRHNDDLCRHPIVILLELINDTAPWFLCRNPLPRSSIEICMQIFKEILQKSARVTSQILHLDLNYLSWTDRNDCNSLDPVHDGVSYVGNNLKQNINSKINFCATSCNKFGCWNLKFKRFFHDVIKI